MSEENFKKDYVKNDNSEMSENPSRLEGSRLGEGRRSTYHIGFEYQKKNIPVYKGKEI